MRHALTSRWRSFAALLALVLLGVLMLVSRLARADVATATVPVYVAGDDGVIGTVMPFAQLGSWGVIAWLVLSELRQLRAAINVLLVSRVDPDAGAARAEDKPRVRSRDSQRPPSG